jgi:hypothetical protein
LFDFAWAARYVLFWMDNGVVEFAGINALAMGVLL